MTPTLLAAKFNNYQCLTLLVDNGADLYVVDNRMQNVLHYAILNENENMIKYLISKDQKFQLRKEKNVCGLIPMELEKSAKFMTWLYTIWDAVNGGMTQLVIKYLNEKSYDINQKRQSDHKTPLHLAIQNKNVDLVK